MLSVSQVMSPVTRALVCSLTLPPVSLPLNRPLITMLAAWISPSTSPVSSMTIVDASTRPLT
jgi:hypothetical protein